MIGAIIITIIISNGMIEKAKLLIQLLKKLKFFESILAIFIFL
jgi:hypothetical protein